ncbi:MAG: S1 RNA-binding domain-containing protein [candidate division Zixibacteria bacterium]|nr:S1 RNA-binding domain-containing protein [candidate division Zixibacteria bacterium]
MFEWFDDPKHQVAVVVGPTGSGKSTVLPYRLINPPSGIPEDRFTRYGQVLITQPRIQATRNIAAYVAKDLYGSSIGSGFDVGFRYKDNPYSDWRNRLVYATDGTLINWIANGQIANLSVIMIDEAHERSLNIDLILGLLKKLLPRYPHLKLIVASATIDKGLFTDYFGSETAKLIEFQGQRKGQRKFKLDTYYMDETNTLPYDNLPKLMKNISAEVAKKVIWILEEIAAGRKDPGDILAFLQGEKPIEKAVTIIRQAVKSNEKLSNVDVFPLYTTLPQEEQNKALLKKKGPTRRRVVVTTNVAETSLTVEGIVYVVDCGLINESQWIGSGQTKNKQVVPVLHSKAGCEQRWGRSGRVSNGQAYCLYTKKQFETLFLDYTVPQIKRSDLESVVLAAKTAGIDDLTTFHWIQEPPPEELKRAPESLQKIGAIDKDGFLTEHGLELQSFGEEPAMGHLMAMADRFSCAIEMATIIPMIKLGGMRHLFRNEERWDAATRREVNRIHRALTKGCVDDIELCLKIYTAWSDPDIKGLSLTPYWAFSEAWTKYISQLQLTESLQDELDERLLEFKEKIAFFVISTQDLEALVKEFGDGEHIKLWFEDAKSAITRTKREAWAKSHFINHSLLKNKIEPERETLLEALSGHKKEEERRSINFDLLDRVRIIFAYCLPDRRYRLVNTQGMNGISDIASYQPWGNIESSQNEQEKSQPIIQINQDSVYYGHTPEIFVCGRQQVVTRRISPVLPPTPALYVSYLSLVRQEWLKKLEETDLSVLRLATFISQQTRDPLSGELKQTNAYERLFLDQIFPIRSRYQCKIITEESNGIVELKPIKHISDPIEVIEDFREDEPLISESIDIVENVDFESGELADNVLTKKDNPIPNLEEEIQPPCNDLEGHPTDDNLLNISQKDRQDAAILNHLEKFDIKQFSKNNHWYLQISQSSGDFNIGDTVITEVVDYSFDEKNQFITFVRIVPSPEPFDVFIKKYSIGDTITLKTISYDERPGDSLISLVAQEPISGLEIVLDPEKLIFTPRGFAVKKIPLGIDIKAEVEYIDKARRKVGLSCLPLLENNLNDLIASKRNQEGIFELETATVGDVSQERIFLLLPWSNPEKGLIHVVKVAGGGLYKQAESYTIGEECTVRISLPKNTSHRSIQEIPEEITSHIEGEERVFSNLSWENGSLNYVGRMTNSIRNSLKSPTNDRNYHRAIDDLYRFSNQLRADTIDTEWETEWRTRVKNYYPIGTRVKVRILRILDILGAFAELEPKIEGLIHKSKMAWGRVVVPSEVVEIGDEVDVIVENIDFENRKIGLSMLIVDPLLKYKLEQRVMGTVKVIISAGLIVELEAGVRGLVHISQVCNNFISPEELSEKFRIGEKVKVVILKIDMEKRRLSMSIKQA